ncbi:MAG: hypothetical protein JWO43_121 [Candidatus Adlerbacteria bacterium]|nr:hypothetical protein [Candidatus Adlerbacteria bacterium]
MLTKIEDDLTIFVQLIISLSHNKKANFEKEFDSRYSALRAVSEKTIKNHRTEMMSLFGLIKETEDGFIETSARALLLVETQNFQLFFKTVCHRFQFPNAINKSQETIRQLEQNVKFKPASFILQLLKEANTKYGEGFKITGAEVSNLIFNDLRVVAGAISPTQLLNTLVELRKQEEQFDGDSNHAQHGREFLGYMFLAGLVDSDDARRTFFLNLKELGAIDFIIYSDLFFEIPKEYTSSAKVRKETQLDWDIWYGDVSDIEIKKLSSSDATLEYIEEKIATISMPGTVEKNAGVSVPAGFHKRQIGDIGEGVAYKYEVEQIKKIRPDKLGVVKLVSNDTSLGYDIQSVQLEDVNKKKLIEVKTTIRTFMPESEIITFFPMSANEWETAKNYGNMYFIYRVFITKDSAQIFVIQNPVEQENAKNIIIEPLQYRVLVKPQAGTYLPEIKMR